VERGADRIERRPAISGRTLPYPGHVEVQTGTAVHFGRGGRRPGLVAHAEHWQHVEATLYQFTVYYRFAEGRHVQQCECVVPDALCGRHVGGAADGEREKIRFCIFLTNKKKIRILNKMTYFEK
jgi:hypothetical protein